MSGRLSGASLAAALALIIVAGPAAAQDGDPIRLAVILPLSGPYARSGELELAGIRLAADEINAAGGIKSLNGRKLTLAVQDTGTTVESAISAARTLLASGTKISGGIGAWLSSFTLGVTEVAERRHVPWLTVSSSDQVSNRGLRFLYQIVAPSSVWANRGLSYLKALSEAKGCPIRIVAIVGDNSASPTAFFGAVRNGVAQRLGWQITVDATWTPPLADATAIAQRLKAAKPDLVLFGASNFADAAQVLGKGVEFNIKTNYLGNGSWLVMPEYIQGVGSQNIDGIFAISGAHPLQGFGTTETRFKARTNEPFIQQEGIAGYTNVWIFKEALEKAESAEPEAVNTAIRSLDLSTGPAAASLPSGRVKFDDKGLLVDATPVVAQWQAGVPVSVYPTDRALALGQFRCER